jgi:hypothetical protein
MGVDVENMVESAREDLLKVEQKRIMDLMKINFEYLHECFMGDEIFFYEMPLPLEIVVDYQRTEKKKPKDYQRFMIKSKSKNVGHQKSQPILLAKTPLKKPKEVLIVNFRGGRASRQKLSMEFMKLVDVVKERLKLEK